MRAYLLSLATMAFCIVVTQSQVTHSTSLVESTTSVPAASSLKTVLLGFLPDQLLQDFELFKSQFKKHYTALEETARKRIFLGNLFHSFLSKISYSQGMSSHYYGLNQMSDWTEEEIERSFPPDSPNSKRDELLVALEYTGQQIDSDEIDKILAKQEEQRLASSDISNVVDTEPAIPVANIEDIEHGIEQIQSLDSQADGLKSSSEIIDTINQIDSKIEEKISSAKVDQKGQPEVEKEVESVEPLAKKQVESILKEPGAGYVESAIGWLSSWYKGSAEPEISVDLNLPDEIFIDHRDKGCVLRPKNQYDCGSCYIFSTISLYEWIHCKASGQLVSFSEQYPMDCGWRYMLRGCNGGYAPQVAMFVATYGVELSSNYPYKAREDVCPYSFLTDGADKMGFIKFDKSKLKLIWVKDLEEHLKRSPIIITFYYDPKTFFKYGGGVDYVKDFGPYQSHSVLVVGSGREQGREYWLIRNSFGIFWGEKGYYRLDKKSPNICSYGYAPPDDLEGSTHLSQPPQEKNQTE